MTAKEMFEKLDYIKVKDFNHYILYKDKRLSRYIEFVSNLTGSIKQISCWQKGWIFKHNIYLTMDELQAINKQIEELGWK